MTEQRDTTPADLKETAATLAEQRDGVVVLDRLVFDSGSLP